MNNVVIDSLDHVEEVGGLVAQRQLLPRHRGHVWGVCVRDLSKRPVNLIKIVTYSVPTNFRLELIEQSAREVEGQHFF